MSVICVQLYAYISTISIITIIIMFESPSSQSFALTDMAVQNFVGDAFRGATWVALHNGGGVGW